MKYRWGNNSKRKTMKGRECMIIAEGRMGSVCIEFLDNEQHEIVSWRSVY
jgi:hypothetical protein